ncbi:MAG: hypothetical protein HY903_08980 [Deltaproteobacteria bacterium]|nr:hypothetical protein [Deltaproteobacteria bacterium]
MRMPKVMSAALIFVVAGCSSDDADRGSPPGGPGLLKTSKAVTGAMEAELTLSNGAALKIPFGAVPAGEAGGFPLEFTLATVSTSVVPPANESLASSVYELGPGHFVFSREVVLSIPVAGNPQAEQVRVYRVDPDTQELEPYNAVYDSATGKVSVQTRTFSPWFATVAPAGDSTAAGAFKITNTSTDSWINVCATSFQPKYAGQGAGDVFEPIAVAPGGTIGWQNVIHWYVPQGTYSLCVESQRAGTVSSAPGAPSYILVASQSVDAPWRYNAPVTTDLSFGTLTGATSGSCTCTPTPTTADRIFYFGNIDAVYNQPTAPTVFTTTQCYFVAHLGTYHWNNGSGMTPGTVSLTSAEGARTYGPWRASGTPGQGGVVDAYWNTYPAVVLPVGTYTVVDSDPDTWSQNAGTGGAGMAWADGVPVECP